MEKDDTDSMLAVRKGLELGYRRFELYGALDGERLDHTVANLQALTFLRSQGARGYLLGREQIATVIADEQAVFHGAKGILSVFCMGETATGVTIQGMQYELENSTLSADFPLGVSNHFIGKEAEISVAKGSLLLLWDVDNPLPNLE